MVGYVNGDYKPGQRVVEEPGYLVQDLQDLLGNNILNEIGDIYQVAYGYSEPVGETISWFLLRIGTSAVVVREFQVVKLICRKEQLYDILYNFGAEENQPKVKKAMGDHRWVADRFFKKHPAKLQDVVAKLRVATSN